MVVVVVAAAAAVVVACLPSSALKLFSFHGHFVVVFMIAKTRSLNHESHIQATSKSKQLQAAPTMAEVEGAVILGRTLGSTQTCHCRLEP